MVEGGVVSRMVEEDGNGGGGGRGGWWKPWSWLWREREGERSENGSVNEICKGWTCLYRNK